MHRIVLLLALLVSTMPAWAAEPVGEWLVADGSARIKIDNCGGGLWGVISWEKQAGRDENNPDPSKRDRPTLGLPILIDMKSNQAGQWNGDVYNAENGKIYTAHISLVSADILKIAGCVLGILCGGENWTRFKAPSDVSKGRTAPPGVDVCSSVTRATGTPHERRLK